MDILYVVGTGSKWENNELRYSLRSIAKYGRNIDMVYLVGYKPDFVSDRVRHLSCSDEYGSKHKNIMHKVLMAIEKTNIAGHFLISSDDHFYLRETDFDNLPVYYRYAEIPHEFPEGEHMNNYQQSLRDTYFMLNKYGLPTYQTNPHCNTHFRNDIYQRNKYLFKEAMQMAHGGELNCIMGNLMVNDGVTPVRYKDSKLGDEKFADRTVLLNRIKDVECMSMSDKALCWNIGDFLQSIFPDKCKYER